MSDVLLDLREEVERGKDAGMTRGFGNRLTEIAVRYDAIVRAYSPRKRFTNTEWQILTDALIRDWPKHDLPPIDLGERVHRTVEAALFVDDSGQVISGNNLLVKVRDLDLVTCIALLEVIYREVIAEL